MVLERDKKGQVATAELPASDLPKSRPSPGNKALLQLPKEVAIHTLLDSHPRQRPHSPEAAQGLPATSSGLRLEPPIQYMPWAPLVNSDPGLSLRTRRARRHKPWKPCMIIHDRCRTGTGTSALGGQTGGPLSGQGPGMLTLPLWLTECLQLTPPGEVGSACQGWGHRGQ